MRRIEALLVLGVDLVGISSKSVNARKAKTVFKFKAKPFEDLKGLMVKQAAGNRIALLKRGTIVLKGR